ncbi:MAG: RpiB/LacA/LacB family sugar-phosphate isomerase [Clostridiales bacterium]|nr:RpiB/LacA/LacB family sugar-phosphate isomerase [Clostridiales bacterium]
MKIAIAADHGGFELKEQIKAAFSEPGIELVDLGTDSTESVDYPLFGRKCAEYVASGQAERGIVICRSGIGVSIAANKVHGIRCALVAGDEYARLASEHNHANMIAFGGGFTSPEDALRYIKIWLETPWGSGRHDRRVAELDEM